MVVQGCYMNVKIHFRALTLFAEKIQIAICLRNNSMVAIEAQLYYSCKSNPAAFTVPIRYAVGHGMDEKRRERLDEREWIWMNCPSLRRMSLDRGQFSHFPANLKWELAVNCLPFHQ